jgi:hypothetical protein
MSIKIPEETGTPGWLELYDLSLHSDVESRLPYGPYIHGLMDAEDHFYPDQPFTVITE